MSSGKNVIEFRNDHENKYYCFSNFYDFKFTHVFTSEGGQIFKKKFDNVEQGFQYLSFFKLAENKISADSIKKMLRLIMKEKSASQVRKMCNSSQYIDRKTGLAKNIKRRPDWDSAAEKNSPELKYLFLFDLLKSRFEQDKESAEILLSTGDSILRECSENSKEENMYGRILMGIRKILKGHQ